MNDLSPKQFAWGILFLLYPIAVYLGLSFLDPRLLALLLIIVAGYRFLDGHLHKTTRIPLIVAVVVAAGSTFITGSHYGLLFYPVLMNVALLVIFAASLLRPPAVIESLARLREPELPDAAVDYTRKVTLVWTVFFAVNGTISFVTVYMDQTWWVLYNGFIAYLMMGSLFCGEWLVRRRIRSRSHA